MAWILICIYDNNYFMWYFIKAACFEVLIQLINKIASWNVWQTNTKYFMINHAITPVWAAHYKQQQLQDGPMYSPRHKCAGSSLYDYNGSQSKLWVLYCTLDALKRCRGSHCPFRSFKLCSSRNATGTALHYTNSSFWSHTRWPANSL